MLLSNLFTWLKSTYRSMIYVVCAFSIQVMLVAFIGLLCWPSVLPEDTVSQFFVIARRKKG